MKHRPMTICAIALVSILPVPVSANLPFAADSQQEQKAPMTTENFVRSVAIMSRYQIQSSKIAADRTDNRAIEEYAKNMVSAYEEMSKSLRHAVSASKLNIPPINQLDEAHEKQLQALQATSDEVFDREYMAAQQASHQAAIERFTHYSQHGDNLELKNFATRTLPALQSSLSRAGSSPNNK